MKTALALITLVSVGGITIIQGIEPLLAPLLRAFGH